MMDINEVFNELDKINDEGLNEGKSSHAFYEIDIQNEYGNTIECSSELEYYPNQKQLDAYIAKAKEIEKRNNSKVKVTLSERRPDWDDMGYGDIYNELKVVYQTPGYKYKGLYGC